MRTLIVTGSDTGVGKTHAVACLARLLSAGGARVRIVKPVETGAPAEPDAVRARRLSGVNVEVTTLVSFPAAIAPASAARASGQSVSFDELAAGVRSLTDADWLLVEGAGGVASPIDDEAHDWADFARAVGADALVVVVPDRLGAINQARLAHARALASGCPAGIWLNSPVPAPPEVAASNREGLVSSGLPIWGEQARGAVDPMDRAGTRAAILAACGVDTVAADPGFRQDARPDTETAWLRRARGVLAERAASGTLRTLRVAPAGDVLNLADNDYLALARDPAVAAALSASAAEHGTSASASPLITGWRGPHEALLRELCEWHGLPCGMLFNSGYSANAAVLGVLPRRGDLVLADRLIHHSMIAGILRSGARLQRYEHGDLAHLERLLVRESGSGRTVFVATESVFSMDGDCTDVGRLAEMKRRFGFCWILDEAHALGWYGPRGAGLARAAGAEGAIDVLVGTLGKTLASGGAYVLLRDAEVRDQLVNLAGEFIYSTAMPPANAAAALAALRRVGELASGQPDWHARSRRFREKLIAEGWQASPGDSPIVPVRMAAPAAATALAGALRDEGILVAAVRPPTVPAGTSRLRMSLKRTFGDADENRVIEAMAAWRRRS